MSLINGNRKFRFTAFPLQPFTVAATSFALDFKGEVRDNGESILGIDIKFAWELTNLGLPEGLEQRQVLEDRLEEIAHTYLGLVGDLEIDYGTAQARTYNDITFKAFNPLDITSPKVIKYDCAFEWPIVQGGAKYAREIQFNSDTLTAQNFIIETTLEDRTSFIPLWRAAPVRIANGPGLRTVLITGFLHDIVQSGLAGRQEAEDAIKQLQDDHTGQASELIIDQTSWGQAHCRAVRPTDLTLGDVFAFDMEFVQGYSA